MRRRYRDPNGVVHIATDSGRTNVRIATCELVFDRNWPTALLARAGRAPVTCLMCLARTRDM